MLKNSLAHFSAAACVATLALVAASAAQAGEVRWRGELDLVAAEHSDAFLLNTFERGDTPYDPYRLRLFAESPVGDRTQVFVQAVFADVTNPWIDGAYAQVTPWANRDLHVLAGKVPWAVGTWAPRTYANKNPLIGTPLLYQHTTSLVWYDLPGGADQLLAAAGTGAKGVNYGYYTEGRGMPIVDDSYWDVGVTINGSERPLEYAFGVSSGTPSWASTARDDNSGSSVLGRIGFAPTPSLRVGVSGAYGPYLNGALLGALPAGKTITDYHQQLAMADLEVLFGHLEFRAEGAHNIWQSPFVGDLRVDAGYAELKVLLESGFYLAGRAETEQFGKITASSGERKPWDWNMARGEGGVGYRVSRDATAKITYQHSRFDTGAPGHRWRDLGMVAGQLSLQF